MFAGAFSPAWRAAHSKVPEPKNPGLNLLGIAIGDGAARARTAAPRCETVAAVADEGDDYEMGIESARTLIGAGDRILGFAAGAVVVAVACAAWSFF